jgi:hypothetical protein
MAGVLHGDLITFINKEGQMNDTRKVNPLDKTPRHPQPGTQDDLPKRNPDYTDDLPARNPDYTTDGATVIQPDAIEDSNLEE